MVQELTAWKKKYTIRNPNTGVLEGHKTYVNINFKRGMRKDFRDIRFTDKKGNLLPHFRIQYVEFSWAQFWVWLPAPTANPVLYCHFGNGAVQSVSSFDSIQGLFLDYFESGAADSAKWDLKTYGSWITAGIRTDIKYNNYSLGLDYVRPGIMMLGQDQGHALLKIPLTSMPVGSRTFLFMLSYRRTTATAADFMGFGNGLDSTAGCLYSLPADSTWHDYLIKIYRSDVNTWDIYIMKDGVLDASLVGVSRAYSTNFLFGLQAYDLNGNVSELTRIDNIIAYLEPSAGWFSGYPGALAWGQRCLIPYRKAPYSHTITAEAVTKLTVSIAGYQDSINYEVGGLKLSKPSFAFGVPDEITEDVGITLSAPTATIIDYEGLEDFALVSSTVKKGINDSYWGFSGAFEGSLVPEAGAMIKFNARKPDGNSQILFSGKVVSNRPAFAFIGDSIAMEAVDFAQNLAIQKIPWDARAIKLNDVYSAWDLWVSYLCNFSENNLVPRVINRPLTGSTEISLDPKSSRLEAIKKICEYTGYLFITKLINNGTEETPIWKTGVYFLDPADLDNSAGGLDLPSPVTLTAPDSSLLDAPGLEPDLENNYNMVTVYGTLSSDGLFYTMTACTPQVALGRETAREYRYEDNKISEKGTTFQNEAIKWLLYFSTRQSTVKMKFIDRFDFELFQRVRFGEGFNTTLQGLTNLRAFTTVRVYDPQDPINYQDIDVSGVPRPSWLRITDISYSCSNLQNIVSITAKTDWIYSNSDPHIDPAYSQYIGSGYYKPEIEDSTSTTQGMIDNSISKQAGAQKGTVLSISSDGKTAEILTDDGKTITAKIATQTAAGANVLVIPGAAGSYYIN
jgi:hypothetical protein